MSKPNTEKLLRFVNESPKLSVFLHILCYLCTLSCVFSFGYMLMHFAMRSLVLVLGFCLALALPLVAVSILRRLVNAQRPYEIYDFYTVPPKNKQGSSFPSRHAFSAFAIGTLCMFINPIIGGITLFLGLVMCFCRVALGIHFVRDVLCGGLIGIISSLLGVLILL